MTAQRYKVVHAEADADTPLPIERAALAAIGAELICSGARSTAELLAVAHDADLVLSETAVIPRELIEGLWHCQAIVVYAIGLDHVDLAAATEQGILIAYTPGFCAEEVANHAMLFVLACARRLLPLQTKLRNGYWPDWARAEQTLLPMGSLYGERLGLLSLGSIARSLAAKAQVFGLEVVAHDPFVSAEAMRTLGVQPVSLAELLATSDYLSIHTPLTAQTHHLIGSEQLRQMKRSAFLINTSRGAVIDEAALIHALQAGWIAGAGLDVFENEPPASDNPLLHMENVVATPHTAYCSAGAYRRVRQMAASEAVRVLTGQFPLALANPAVKGRSRMEKNLRF